MCWMRSWQKPTPEQVQRAIAVFAAIEKMPQTENHRVREDIAETAAVMPGAQAARCFHRVFGSCGLGECPPCLGGGGVGAADVAQDGGRVGGEVGEVVGEV